MSQQRKLGFAALICGILLLVVARSYTSVRRIPAAVGVEPSHRPRPAIEKPAVAQELRMPRAPTLIVPLSLSPEKESLVDKTKRLLALVNSRETAIEYLQSMVDQNPVATKRAEEIPRIEILPATELSVEEQANLHERQKYSKGGLLIARVDDAIRFFEISDPIPADIIPPHVRSFLTDDDIRDFQTKVEVSCLENSVASTKSRRGRVP